MREIKFRAKEINNGKWVYGFLIKNSVAIRIIGEHSLYYDDKTMGYYHFEADIWNVDENTIGQFIGKYDKNKNPIYEGDIVKANKEFYSTNIAEIRWLNDRCAFYFIAKTIGTDIINRNPYESAYKINSLKVEIIGNIYEHPELLK